jgi:hypothetical protein
MKIIDGHKALYATNATALLAAFDGAATSGNIAKLSQRFRLPVDILRRGLAQRPLAGHRTASVLPSNAGSPATHIRNSSDRSAEEAREQVARSWRQTYGRVT